MEKEFNHYVRNSLLQLRIIEKIHSAVEHQKMPELVHEAKRALDHGIRPRISIDGQSGTYFIPGTNREILGVFKPFDEEIGAPNNPLGHLFQGALGQRRIRKSVKTGESVHHEVAAYLVDDFFGFGLVPPTYYAQFESEMFFLHDENRMQGLRKKVKCGSFQEYLYGYKTLKKVSKEHAHAIDLLQYQMLMVLDVIIGNSDRNNGNIFFGENELAAIDHGFAFPDNLDEPLATWWWGAEFLQSKPLHSGLAYLLNHFPFEELGWKLRKRCFIEVAALQRMQERIVLFSEGVNAGLVPFRLLELMQKEFLEPLQDLKMTLRQKAKEVVQKYISTLQK